jgi:four helix bundle protein
MRKGDDISERLIDYAVRIIHVSRALPKDEVGKHISGQVMRAGTGAGANYEEGRGAESRADFVHKVGVSWKEAKESLFWLKVIHRAKLIKPDRLTGIIQESNELCAILASSRSTARAGGKTR